tara:strand:+ start:149 stop:253 length:105 start_codon:yes stop_codon:yes gene_type:complete
MTKRYEVGTAEGFIWTAYGIDHEPIREYKQQGKG